MNESGLAAEGGMVEFDKYRKFGAYHWKLIQTHQDYLRRVEVVCAHIRRNDRVLDLGCGDGAYLYYVSRRCRAVTGVDGDLAGVTCARRELANAGVANASVVHSTFRDLGRHLPPGARFDFIYSMDCIEHLLDPRELLDVADRYLALGGRVLIGTPLFISTEAVSKYHVKEYTVEELAALFGPRYEKLGEHFLQAPVPDSSAMPHRFYVFHGRRRHWWWPWLRSAASVKQASDRVESFRLDDTPPPGY